MAVYNGMSLRMCALALATVFLLFVSVEGQVQAGQVPPPQDCDEQGILNALGTCLSLTSLPAKTSSCCSSMNYVHNTIQPSDTCICGIAKLSALAALGLTVGEIKLVISTCVGPAYVPGCL